MIYGSRSWIDSASGRETKERRSGCYVDVQVITGAGHHVYVDKPNKFNELVEKVCQNEDEGAVEVVAESAESSNEIWRTRCQLSLGILQDWFVNSDKIDG